MKKHYFLRVFIGLVLFFNVSASFCQVDGDYRSGQPFVTWGNGSHWQIRIGGSWSTATTPPTSSTNVFIQAGHTATLTGNGTCRDLNLNTNNSVTTRLSLAANTLSVYGKLRAFNDATSFVDATDYFTTSTSSLNSSNAWITSTTGKISVVGGSRILTTSGEWGAGNAGTNSPNGFDFELNLNTSQTVTLNTALKARSIDVVSGSLEMLTNNSLLADNGNSGQGNITIGANGMIISAATGVTNHLFGRIASGANPGGTLLVNGSLRLNGNSPQIAMTTIIFNGVVEYARPNTQSFLTAPVSGAIPNQYSSLILSGTSAKTMTFSTIVSDSLLISGIASLSTGGFLILKSTSSKTARIARITSSATAPISGNLTVERYIPLTISGGRSGRAWRLLTAPVVGPTIHGAWQEGRTPIASAAAASSEPSAYGTLITAGNIYADAASANAAGFDFIGGTGTPSIRAYKQGVSGGSWGDTVRTSSLIHSREAYMVFIRGDRTVTTGAGSTTLRATGAYKNGVSVHVSNDSGYTLVGNPFPSNIDFESIYTSNSSAIQRRFWIWDATAGSFGGYKLINWTSGDGAAAQYEAIPYVMGNQGTPTVTNTDLRTIQSGQGFFLEPKGPSGGTVNITEAHKTSATPITNIFRIGNGTAEKLYINLNLLEADNTAILADGVQAKFDAGHSASYDNEDIQKPNNFNENLAIYRNGNYMILERRPLISISDTTYLNMWNVTERNYQMQLKADNVSTPGLSAFLVDKYTGASSPVSLTGSITSINFSVNANAASKALDRFMVVYRINNTLPVSFTNIKASQRNAAIQVEWNVATETDTKSYEVEKSTNGQQFTKAATVIATGNSTYSWLDVTPLPGVNYYRVRGISANGQAKYTAVVKVDLGNNKKGIMVYPNPVVDKNFNLQISNIQKGNYTLRITNSVGQIVFTKTIKHSGGSATQTIQLDNMLYRGVYQLEITGEDGSKEITQIVNN